MKNLYFLFFYVFVLYGCEKEVCPPLSKIATKKDTTTNPSIVTDTNTVINGWNIRTTTNNFLIAVDFLNETTGVIVGIGGTILRTTDGTTFQQITSGTTQNLYALDMVNTSIGYAGGDAGALLKTTNGGATWQALTSPTTDNFRKLYFFDTNIGFAGCGDGELYRTTDGGQTWTTINSGAPSGIYGMFFFDNNTGFLSGQNGRIAKTTDGGITWTNLNSGVSTANGSIIGNIQFLNTLVGYCSGSVNVGGGTIIQDTYILKTTDGGQNWARQTIPFTNQVITGFEMLDVNTGYASGGDVTTNAGFILKTTNGQNWTSVYSTNNRLMGMCILDKGEGFVVGNHGTIVQGTH